MLSSESSNGSTLVSRICRSWASRGTDRISAATLWLSTTISPSDPTLTDSTVSVWTSAAAIRRGASVTISTLYACSSSFARIARKAKKADFRQLWIARLNAACRLRGITYSRLIRGLRTADVQLDRKHLADLAVNDTPAFQQLIDLATASKN